MQRPDSEGIQRADFATLGAICSAAVQVGFEVGSLLDMRPLEGGAQLVGTVEQCCLDSFPRSRCSQSSVVADLPAIRERFDSLHSS